MDKQYTFYADFQWTDNLYTHKSLPFFPCLSLHFFESLLKLGNLPLQKHILDEAARMYIDTCVHVYIPITNRVRGLYRKLRTKFFPPRFMVQESAGHKSKGKNEDPYLTVRTEKTRLLRYLLYL